MVRTLKYKRKFRRARPFKRYVKRRYARRTLKGTRKGTRKSKYKRVVGAKVRPHKPLSHNLDREHFIIDAVCEAKMNWIPQQNGVGGAQFDHGDGFLLAMNAMSTVYGSNGRGVSQGGLPTATVGAGQGIVFERFGTGNSFFDIPADLPTIFLRFAQACVTHGVYTIEVHNNTNPMAYQAVSDHPGNVQMAVCGIPLRAGLQYSGGVASGHVMYPNSSATPLLGSALDDMSFSNLRNEPNAKYASMSTSIGSKTAMKIVYPFNMKKYAPLGYWTSGVFFQDSSLNTGNPDFAFQPNILTQFLTDTEGGVELDFRVSMKMRFYCTAFQRRMISQAP